MPVAQSDLALVAADYRAGGFRIGSEAYYRWSEGLVLVAPRSVEPFATSGFAIGSGRVTGFSLSAATGGPRA